MRTIIDRLPSNWEDVLITVAHYYRWGREETWNCTMSELMIWYEHMVKDYERQKQT